MPFAETYRRQAALLMRVVPFIAEEPSLALKGGTAINLFIREMPRLSVDIDLTYVPVQPRAESLATIEAALRRIAERLRAAIKDAAITESKIEDHVNKLLVRAGGVQIKIEANTVIRGCVHQPQLRQVTGAVEAAFGFAEANIASFPDLYAGKIVAALDRQHPRDLFDTRDLLANEGIDETLRRAFVVYMLSHSRPMHEVLRPTRLDISQEVKRGFDGMTDKPVSVEELVAAREALIEDVVGRMPAAHRKFLISFERGEPDWPLLGLDGVMDLPAIGWRQLNLDKLTAEKRAALVAQLEEVLRG